MTIDAPADLAVSDHSLFDPETVRIAGLLLVTEYPPLPSVIENREDDPILRVVTPYVYVRIRAGAVIVISA